MRAVALTAFLLPLRLHAQTLQPVGASASTSNPTATYLDIFAGGNVKNAMGEAEAPSPVSGSLGMRYRGAVYTVTGLINVAGTADTVSGAYGASLLPPAAGGALNAALLDIRSPRFYFLNQKCQGGASVNIPCHFGFHVYATASTNSWATSLDSAGHALSAATVPSWGSGADLSYTFVNGVIQDSNYVTMVFDVGIATRHLRGDISGNDPLRKTLLGSTDTNFFGLEVALNMQYNAITAGVTYYRMNGAIDGLSRGQIIAGVGIQTNLNSGQLK